MRRGTMEVKVIIPRLEQTAVMESELQMIKKVKMK